MEALIRKGVVNRTIFSIRDDDTIFIGYQQLSKIPRDFYVNSALVDDPTPPAISGILIGKENIKSIQSVGKVAQKKSTKGQIVSDFLTELKYNFSEKDRSSMLILLKELKSHALINKLLNKNYKNVEVYASPENLEQVIQELKSKGYPVS